MHTVEPGEKRTHLCRLPDLKFSPIFVLRPFMKSFRCELCAWGTLNMSGDVEKNASVFLVCKNHWILSFSGRLSLLRPGYETKNHSRLRNSLMSWEYLALGACSTSDDNSELMPGPHAVLVVDGPDNGPETSPTHFPASPLSLPATRQPYDLVAPLWATKHRAGSPELMTCRHLEYARHAGAAGLFSQQDQKPYLNQAKCKRAAGRGLSGGGPHKRGEAGITTIEEGAIARAPPFH